MYSYRLYLEAAGKAQILNFLDNYRYNKWNNNENDKQIKLKI